MLRHASLCSTVSFTTPLGLLVAPLLAAAAEDVDGPDVVPHGLPNPPGLGGILAARNSRTNASRRSAPSRVGGSVFWAPDRPAASPAAFVAAEPTNGAWRSRHWHRALRAGKPGRSPAMRSGVKCGGP